MTKIKHSAVFLSARGREGPTDLEQKENRESAIKCVSHLLL